MNVSPPGAVGRHLTASIVFAACAFAGAELRGRSLLSRMSGDEGMAGTLTGTALSLALGLALAVAILVASSRLLQSAARGGAWMRAWIDQLGSSLASETGAGAAILTAAVAAISEELFFRGLLLPWIGLVASSLLFGAVHLLGGGQARWIWALSATLLGLALGGVAELTGSIAGPVLAHALINVVNVPRVRAAYSRGRVRPGSLGRRSGGKPLGGLLRSKP